MLALSDRIIVVIPTPDPDWFLASRASPDLGKEHHIRIVFDWTRQLTEAP
jgi:hypothetical protein